MIREAIQLQSQNHSESDFESLSFYVIFVSLQSVSITQQGFLNAMVYSWTREELQHIVSFSRRLHRSGNDLDLSTDFAQDGDGSDERFCADEEKEEEEVWETSRSLSTSPALTKKTFVGRSQQ